MDSTLVLSYPYARSVTNGENLRRAKHFYNKNIYHARKNLATYASKPLQNKGKTQIDFKILRFQQSSLNYHHSKSIGGRSTYQECNGKYVVKGISRPSFDFEPNASHPKSILDSVKKSLDVFFRFSRPEAMIAQALYMISTSLFALEKLSDISPLFFIGVLQAVVPHLFMNTYVVGMNQLCDLEIDKSLLLGLLIGSWPLFMGLLLCCLLWASYSINVPFLRWKRHPLLATMCIFTTWTIIFPISSFLHMQTFVFKRPIIFSRSVLSAIAFMSFYSIGLALCKDIPDVEGDTLFGIYTLSARLGQKKVFWICFSLFEMAFGVAFLVGVTSPYLWTKVITGLGHGVLASILWYRTKSIDLSSKASTTSFYVFMWKLMCVEFFLMPLVR